LQDGAINESVLEALWALQREGQPDFPSKIVTLYLDTAPSVLRELETAAAAADASLLHITLHRLHSASTAIGAVRLVALSKEAEAITRAGHLPPDATERVQAIADEYARVEAALISWCAAR
jgi:HPt (histidine-containing phosphotransfer) domain-containing protein